MWHEESVQIWRKPLADGTHALLLFNGGDRPIDITTRWARDLADASRPHEQEVRNHTRTCARTHRRIRNRT